MTRFTDVGTVAVGVADHDRAIAFYTGMLGFEVRMDAEFAPGQRWAEVASPGAHTSIALVTPEEGEQVGRDTGIRLATTDAAGDHAELQAAGVATSDLLAWEGVPPMFSFRDPDGNELYVVER